MFLKKAANIISKEGIRTFGYVLSQKMHQNISDEQAYKNYLKKIAPIQKVIDDEADCIEVCEHCEDYDSIIKEISLKNAEYIAVCSENYVFDKEFTKVVSHYIRIQKKSGRDLKYVYSDSEKYNMSTGVYLPDCKPDYSWDTLLSYNYIGNAYVVRKDVLIDAINACRNDSNIPDEIDFYKLSLQILIVCEACEVGHIHQILVREDMTSANSLYNIADYKQSLLEKAGIRNNVVADNNDNKVTHVNYVLNDSDNVSIIIPSKDNPELLKRCFDSIIKYTKNTKYEIIVVDNGSNNDNRKQYEKLINGFDGRALYLYEKADFNFSHMCNIGAAKAKGNLILFLNDDIEIIDYEYENRDWLSVLAGQAKVKSTGAVGAKLLYPDSSYIQHIGVVNYESSCFAHLYAKSVDDSRIKAYRNYAEYNCLCVTGACFMLEKKKFFEVGGFDEAFNVTHNDVDICLSLYEKGYYNVLRNDVILYHHESFSRGDDEIDEGKNRRNMYARDLVYKKHPEFEKYDPFYSPLLTQIENDYKFGNEIYSVIYKRPREVKDKYIDSIILRKSPTVVITESGYHDDMQLRGFAYNKNKVYYNPEIYLYNKENCYKIKALSVCDRVFHIRKGIDKHINYAPFYCGIDTSVMKHGIYKCVIKAKGKYYDANNSIVIGDKNTL